MGIAAIASGRSKDPDTQNGAAIFHPVTHKLMAIGYNGFPRGCADDEFPWDRDAKDPYDSKYSYSRHAEANCLDNRLLPVDGGIMFLYSEKGYYPCSTCAQGIIQNGIVEVVMAFAVDAPTDVYDWRPTKRMFKAAGVKIRVLKDFDLKFNNLAALMSRCAKKISARGA